MGIFNSPFIIFFIGFLLTSLSGGAVFIFIIVYALKQKSKNDKSPRLTVSAKIVDKRTSSHRHHHNGHHSYTHSYYVTFEVDSGDRTELHVPSNEFGLLVVGDIGSLTLQGTRYISFERKLDSDKNDVWH